MPTQALEQMLELAPSNRATSIDYASIDVYTNGASHMEAKLCGCPGGGCVHDMAVADDFRFRREEQSRMAQIVPTNQGAVIPYGNLTGLGGDVHDTLRTNANGNLSNGHLTVNIPEVGKKRFLW